MAWSVIVRAALPQSQVRAIHASACVSKKSAPSLGKARKSPKTLLRLYAEGKLKGAEAAKAAALMEASAGATESGPAVQKKQDDSVSLTEARHILRSVEAARPRNAYELHIVTTVPPNQTNAFRGRIVYPKDPRIKGETALVFADQGTEAAQAAEQAAAQLRESGSSMRLVIGGHEMISETASGRVPPFTRVLCTSALLPSLSRTLARTLGPKGLMPSAKRGTVVEDGEEMQRAIEQLLSGVDWRGDRLGVVRGAVGRISFTDAELRANVHALLDSVIARAAGGLAGTKVSAKVVAGYARDLTREDADGKPLMHRGPSPLKRALSIVQQVHLSSTQGPGLRLRLDDVL
ncbi:hypothetical protein MCAP1_000292 [Malassezia caprae]|uniref:50S ribosomal protein L1 n=1 Tax=Malassezia caprae TaxID=1381934 RepID=A0AAF0E349_9BASI|nr:hypothetical protein MCAP1_000292 [Malassezia caprae]